MESMNKAGACFPRVPSLPWVCICISLCCCMSMNAMTSPAQTRPLLQNPLPPLDCTVSHGTLLPVPHTKLKTHEHPLEDIAFHTFFLSCTDKLSRKCKLRNTECLSSQSMKQPRTRCKRRRRESLLIISWCCSQGGNDTSFGVFLCHQYSGMKNAQCKTSPADHSVKGMLERRRKKMWEYKERRQVHLRERDWTSKTATEKQKCLPAEDSRYYQEAW